jgi:hypothetical protein
MRKCWLCLFAVLVIVVATTSIVRASTFFSPFKDTVCEVFAGGQCENGFGIAPQSGSFLGGPCNPGQIGLIGWDLSTVSDAVGSAQITLTTYQVEGAQPGIPVEFQIFAPTTHTWTEDGAVSPGSSGATLATSSALLSNGLTSQTVVFGGSANPADAILLGEHFEQLRTGSLPESATVGVRISGGCSLSTFVLFNDLDNSGGLPGDPVTTGPQLFLFTPTAVQFVSSSASGDAQTPLAPVLLVVALLGLTALTATLYYKPLLSRRD